MAQIEFMQHLQYSLRSSYGISNPTPGPGVLLEIFSTCTVKQLNKIYGNSDSIEDKITDPESAMHTQLHSNRAFITGKCISDKVLLVATHAIVTCDHISVILVYNLVVYSSHYIYYRSLCKLLQSHDAVRHVN